MEARLPHKEKYYMKKISTEMSWHEKREKTNARETKTAEKLDFYPKLPPSFQLNLFSVLMCKKFQF